MRNITAEIISQAFKEHISVNKTADFLGVNKADLKRKCLELGIPYPTVNNPRKALNPVISTVVEKEETAETIQLREEALIQALASKGYQITKEQEKPAKPVDISRFFGKTLKFAIIADTHLGSQYQQLTYLNQAYKLCEKMEIPIVLHCGDMVDGNGKVYRGHLYEIFLHGADVQRNYIIKKYPRIKGITTYAVSGNHDLSFHKDGGYDIIKAIAAEREDIVYLGQYGGDLHFKGINIALMHGGGGIPYALSYHAQRIIERLAPENKPHILAIGHWHCSFLMPMYRNVVCFLPGCFQAQTPFLRRKGLKPEIGFWTVALTINKFGTKPNIASIEPIWHGSYVPMAEDY